MRQQRLLLDDQDWCLPVLRRKGLTCRQKPEATLFCVDVDSGAWVVQRSCLLRYARRSERRFPAADQTGGRMARWVDELEDRVGDQPQDHVDFGSDTEFESEIEATEGALEPREEK